MVNYLQGQLQNSGVSNLLTYHELGANLPARLEVLVYQKESLMHSSLPPTLLMDLKESFPLRYSKTVAIGSKSDLTKEIKNVASFTSKVYAKFLSLDKEGKGPFQARGVLFRQLDTTPSASACKQFKAALKQKIITDLTQRKTIKLETDLYPTETLEEIVRSVFEQKDQVHLLFPIKTCTTISLKADDTKINLEMNFIAPL